ncbi:pre-mRNA-splicing factor SLU7, putative [Plasmodium gaboni]|uniref:Pre-mRNA-splicing factor SLU7 n=1 Tax=Plasmodium gaboni TaxID=647221 RepID=A0ABY1UK71_9APIC|nr:pre-mRNA-splicing factor SLU7, putative [Plasmodium gaboni]
MNSKNATREEKKKELELNEARKAGKVEALKDEEGNDINPHMPQYIIKAPWYLNQTKPGLKHQRYKGSDKIKIEEERNKKLFLNNNKSQEFCKNCGSVAHKEKDCLERTRKKKVNFMKYDNEDFICVTQDLGYDGNRDRWVGYNVNNFDYIYKEYEKIVEEKKKRKAEDLKKQYEKKSIKKKKIHGNNKNDDNDDNNDDNNDDDEKSSSESENLDESFNEDNKLKADTMDTQNSTINTINKNEKNRNIARNLRIREDTAKYLYNLSLNSAFYDPKSRSMREDPFANIRKHLNDDDNYYKGENYYNNTDDAIESKKLEIFAWESYKRGENVHFNAQPTQLELMYKEYLEKKKKIIKKKQEDILKTYKCQNFQEQQTNQEELLQSEVYTEYKPIEQLNNKNLKKNIKVPSKYEEDIYLFDHSSVFGSYYDKHTKKWGYKCCSSTNKYDKCFQT